jgi:hypothetical protein
METTTTKYQVQFKGNHGNTFNDLGRLYDSPEELLEAAKDAETIPDPDVILTDDMFRIIKRTTVTKIKDELINYHRFKGRNIFRSTFIKNITPFIYNI